MYIYIICSPSDDVSGLLLYVAMGGLPLLGASETRTSKSTITDDAAADPLTH